MSGTDYYYNKIAWLYDSYVGKFRNDLPLYISLCDGRNRILEVGCGTGRVLEALLTAGYNVTGVDISSEMLFVCREKLVSYVKKKMLALLIHDLRYSPLANEYECVLVTFFTFNYLPKYADQAAFLRHIFKSMRSNGVIVMDLFFPSSMFAPHMDNQWKRSTYEVEGKHVVLMQKKKVVSDFEERVERIILEGGPGEEMRTLRRYNDKQKILTLLTSAGFVNIRFADGYYPSGFHGLKKGEVTNTQFVALAEKP